MLHAVDRDRDLGVSHGHRREGTPSAHTRVLAASARAHGHQGIVLNPLLVFTTVFGLTVEDLSEGGGPFLGVNQLSYHQPVYPGDSLVAESVVLDRRVSDSHKGFGIVTWHTTGFNQREERVIDFKRTNLVRQRTAN